MVQRKNDKKRKRFYFILYKHGRIIEREEDLIKVIRKWKKEGIMLDPIGEKIKKTGICTNKMRIKETVKWKSNKFGMNDI